MITVMDGKLVLKLLKITVVQDKYGINKYTIQMENKEN